ncbi:A-kinase anchor protein 14 [Epinephelus moara]|uniref:A-kinase anchor protein 14 n=1 Tax=Epinephelus moara TaxID=300413 RepID=UPI00214F0A7D|nr:A-kinase anchor protein 14 [Epinephelus moara]
MEEENALSLNITTESARLVDSLLERRHCTVTTEQQEEDSSDSEMKNINWVACKDFTVEVGERQIGEYIQTWELQPCWLYSLDFLCSTEEEHHTIYHYRACFSIPTSRRPIQGTASVYFVVDISKIKPQTLPVEVRFIVESNRLVHTPGRSRFGEKWLVDVIESKTLLRRALDL